MRGDFGAEAFVPEGDASGAALFGKTDIGFDAETSEVGQSFEEALPAHEARRVSTRAREDACIETGRPKRMAVNNPMYSPRS